MIEEHLTDPLEGQCHRCGQQGSTGSACSTLSCHGTLYIPRAAAREQQALAHIGPRELIGRMIGDFLVIKALGKGGFGSVYLALKRPSYRTQGALKLFDPAHINEEMAPILRRYFMREIKILSTLNEPNIVQLIDEGEHERCPYFVMRYVGGGQLLRAFMRQESPCAPSFIKLVIPQILRALKAAHQLGVIHRDLKPENVMLQGEEHHVYVLDFGLAKHVQDAHQTTATFGTPYYMAPEQLFPTREELKDDGILDSKPVLQELSQESEPSLERLIKVGPACDLYALGIIIAEMMTGQALFKSQATGELGVEKDRRREDPAATLREVGLPETIYDFLNKALAYRPVDRFRSAEGMRQAFDEALKAYTRHCEANPEHLKTWALPAVADMSSAAFLSTHYDQDGGAQNSSAPLNAETPATSIRSPQDEQILALVQATTIDLAQQHSAPRNLEPPATLRPPPVAQSASTPTPDKSDTDQAPLPDEDEPIYHYTSPRVYVALGVILALITALVTYTLVKPEPEPLKPLAPVVTAYDKELARIRARVETLPGMMAKGDYQRVIDEIREIDKSEARLTPEEHQRVVGILKLSQRELPYARLLASARDRFERNDPAGALETLKTLPQSSAVWARPERRELTLASADVLLRRAYNDLLLRRDEESARVNLNSLLSYIPNHNEARELLTRIEQDAAAALKLHDMGPLASEGSADMGKLKR